MSEERRRALMNQIREYIENSDIKHIKEFVETTDFYEMERRCVDRTEYMESLVERFKRVCKKNYQELNLDIEKCTAMLTRLNDSLEVEME